MTCDLFALNESELLDLAEWLSERTLDLLVTDPQRQPILDRLGTAEGDPPAPVPDPSRHPAEDRDVGDGLAAGAGRSGVQRIRVGNGRLAGRVRGCGQSLTPSPAGAAGGVFCYPAVTLPEASASLRQRKTPGSVMLSGGQLAPRVGLEPTTRRLTVACSTN